MRDMHAAALPPSISLSVSIAPSRRLRMLLFLAALVHGGAAWSILCGALDVAWPWLLAGCAGVAAVLCATAAAQPLKTRQIDISKAGALRLTVQQKLPEPGRAVRLLPGSLLWGALLVLRFGSTDDAAAPPQTILVLPDSTGREAFRALSVAMRAIAGHSSAKDGQKIH
ncbi:protein YgfX [Massilia sp. S19_KUP03_FR1]|uniref:protein YgfX n=1 Tax=Massilia sp. S19_KUP03_FR1 TaxID=3025503 RepID=UPI002FCDA648